MNNLYKTYLATKQLYIDKLLDKDTTIENGNSMLVFLIKVFKNVKRSYFMPIYFDDWLCTLKRESILKYVEKNPDCISNHELMELLNELKK